MCDCRVCTYGREVEKNLSTLTPAQREFFDDMYMRLVDAEDDGSYWRAIVQGVWPSSEEILALHRRPNIPENFQHLSYDQINSTLNTRSF